MFCTYSVPATNNTHVENSEFYLIDTGGSEMIVRVKLIFRSATVILKIFGPEFARQKLKAAFFYWHFNLSRDSFRGKVNFMISDHR